MGPPNENRSHIPKRESCHKHPWNSWGPGSPLLHTCQVAPSTVSYTCCNHMIKSQLFGLAFEAVPSTAQTSLPFFRLGLTGCPWCAIRSAGVKCESYTAPPHREPIAWWGRQTHTQMPIPPLWEPPRARHTPSNGRIGCHGARPT